MIIYELLRTVRPRLKKMHGRHDSLSTSLYTFKPHAHGQRPIKVKV